MKDLFLFLFDYIYYEICILCEKHSISSVCDNCFKDLKKRKNNIKEFEEIKIYSWGMYSGKLRDVILALKSGNKNSSKSLSKILIGYWNEINIPKKDLIVIPIPSHKNRIKERGYCHIGLLCKLLGENLNLKVKYDFVRRRKETKYMSELLHLKDRIKNINNAFEIIGEVNCKNLILVDDILTSGSTMCEMAKTIKKKYPEINLIGITIASGDRFIL